ncbi:hypothetical protein BDZ94DRAFT_1161851, partial [Collybia nuda]
KCVVRIRKRGKLDPNSPYLDKKYDHLFVHTLMSDDEDKIDDQGNKMKQFVSRPPTYRADIVNEIFTTIDDIPDSNGVSNWYVARVRGTPKDYPPPDSRKFEHRARRWMVSPEWLNDPKNKAFDVPARIVDSGRLWGDKKDPKEILAKAKVVEEVKKEIKIAKLEVMMQSGLMSKGMKKNGKAKGKEKEKATEDVGEGSSKRVVANPEDNGDQWQSFY